MEPALPADVAGCRDRYRRPWLDESLDERPLDLGDSASLICWSVGSVVVFALSDALLPLALRRSPSRRSHVRKKFKDQRGPDGNTGDTTTAKAESGDLAKWLARDKPIELPEEDRFGHAPIAKRIARILREESVRTVGLLGPYGCGKSGIINLVEYYLDDSSSAPSRRTTDEIIWCRIGEWGFSKDGAAALVLSRAIHAVSHHVDCLALAGVPSRYSSALGHVSPWLQAALALIRCDESPETVLKSLDDILKCARKRLVICLEDIDRNGSTGDLGDFLDRLKPLENITFVAAFGAASNVDEPFIKVFEHIEIVPQLAYEPVVLLYQDLCRDLSVEPISQTEFRPTLRTSEGLNTSLGVGGNTRPAVPGIIHGLANSPRLLRAAFSRTTTAWRALRDEVDFHELLFIHLLRLCAPAAYAFVNDSLPSQRQGLPTPWLPATGEPAGDRLERLNKRWKARFGDPTTSGTAPSSEAAKAPWSSCSDC